MSDEKHFEPHEEPTANPGQQTDPAQRTEEATSRLGHLLGRTAHRAMQWGEEAAKDARPEAERLARAARAAADAARPRIERAGRNAIQYVRDHDSDIKRAARVSAEITAQQVMPTRLRPIVAAIEADRWKRAPLRDHREPAGPYSAGAEASPSPGSHPATDTPRPTD